MFEAVALKRVSSLGIMSPSGASASPSAPSIDTLFETRGVDELSTYSRTLQRSIDMKREELRVMVGERYRDLMEAAETIQRMKGGSEKVIVITEEMIAKQKQLQAKAVIGESR